MPSQSVNISLPKSQPEGNYVTVKTGRKTLDALVDTGAVMSLINESTARNLKLCVKPITEPNDRPLVSATDSEIQLVGHVIVQSRVKSEYFKLLSSWPRSRFRFLRIAFCVQDRYSRQKVQVFTLFIMYELSN